MSLGDDRTVERSLAVGRGDADGVEHVAAVDAVVALDAPLELDVGGEELAHGGIVEISLDGSHVGLVGGTDGGSAGERRIEHGEERILGAVVTCGLHGDRLLGLADLGDQIAGLAGGGSVLRFLGDGLPDGLARSVSLGLERTQILVGGHHRREDLVGVVGGPELERSGTLQEVADTLRLLDARQLDQDAVRIGQADDVGLRDAEVVDTTAEHVVGSLDGGLGLTLEDLFDLGVGALQRNVLAVGADEDRGEGAAVGLTLVSLDELADIILGRTLLHGFVGLGHGGDEGGIVLALTGQRLDEVLDLHLQHDVHAALEVETEVELLLLAVLVGVGDEAQVVDGQVLDRIEVVLLGLGLLLERELRGIGGRVLLDVPRFERERELENARKRQERRDEFDETFTLHRC